jgi:pectin lyase
MYAYTFFLSFVAAVTGTPLSSRAAVSGSAYGFATGVSGGGSATAAAPSSISELSSWLSDSTARVILIDKTFDFTGTEGSATTAGCYQSTCTLANGGQDYLDTSAGSCDGSNMIATTVTYDVAGTKPLKVAANKSILGVGSAGVIKGKGLQLADGVGNVIIQNVHM